MALNGRGYFYDLDSVIGSGEKAGVKFVGNLNTTYIGDQIYQDYMGRFDPQGGGHVPRQGDPARRL